MNGSLFSQQWPMDSFDELDAMSVASVFCEDFRQPCNPRHPIPDLKRAADLSHVGENRPLKQLKTDTWNSCKRETASNYSPPPSSFQLVNSSSFNIGPSSAAGMAKPKEEARSFSSTLSFTSESFLPQSSFGDHNYMLKPISASTRLGQAQDHILAERKRREQLSQRFIALSALVPGLKKMDKASVLGDAVKHMKQLQENVKALEEQVQKSTLESAAFVKKHLVYADRENPSSHERFCTGPTTTEPLPEIEARFCDKDVLIRIHCEKRNGVFEKAVAEIEKLHLSVANSSFMTFGDSALNITVVAQKDEEFNLNNIKELERKLRGALKLFM